MTEGTMHEITVAKAVEELMEKGYHVVKMSRKTPDAIAFKDGKFYAVEALGQRWTPEQGWTNKRSKIEKERAYAHIGQLIFYSFRYPKTEYQLAKKRNHSQAL